MCAVVACGVGVVMGWPVARRCARAWALLVLMVIVARRGVWWGPCSRALIMFLWFAARLCSCAGLASRHLAFGVFVWCRVFVLAFTYSTIRTTLSVLLHLFKYLQDKLLTINYCHR